VTQNNLGNALQELGRRESGTARLGAARNAYESALDVFNKEHSSYCFEATTPNLARVNKLIEERAKKK